MTAWLSEIRLQETGTRNDQSRFLCLYLAALHVKFNNKNKWLWTLSRCKSSFKNWTWHCIFSDGLINHWVPNHESLVPVHRLRQNTQYEMVDSGSSIRIRQNGMYLIYAQVRPFCINVNVACTLTVTLEDPSGIPKLGLDAHLHFLLFLSISPCFLNS